MNDSSVFFPRVLILIQPFNKKAGGGITLSNLFKGWPKDKLAVAAFGSLIDSETTFDICENYYVLGSKEFVYRFPLNLIKRKIKSGTIMYDGKPDAKRLPQKNKFRSKVSSHLVMPIINFLGLNEFLYDVKLSQSLKDWIAGFNPDIIYAQAHTRGRVLFCSKVQEVLELPMAFHMMDEWPTMVRHEGLFGKYWERRTNSDFCNMLNLCQLHLCISDRMGEEYRARYGHNFLTFHNPIELDFWKRGQRSD